MRCSNFCSQNGSLRLVSDIASDIAVVLFPSVTNPFMQVLRPPARAGGPFERSTPMLTTGLEPCYFTSPLRQL